MKKRKMNDERVTVEFLQHRAKALEEKGYPKAKWIEFCERLMAHGYSMRLYEARQTFSKYITVMARNGRSVKIRFSNHKPIKARELANDCDFFVGITHTGTRTTADALAFVKEHLPIFEVKR
jgi:hypothetical protein